MKRRKFVLMLSSIPFISGCMSSSDNDKSKLDGATGKNGGEKIEDKNNSTKKDGKNRDQKYRDKEQKDRKKDQKEDENDEEVNKNVKNIANLSSNKKIKYLEEPGKFDKRNLARLYGIEAKHDSSFDRSGIISTDPPKFLVSYRVISDSDRKEVSLGEGALISVDYIKEMTDSDSKRRIVLESDDSKIEKREGCPVHPNPPESTQEYLEKQKIRLGLYETKEEVYRLANHPKNEECFPEGIYYFQGKDQFFFGLKIWENPDPKESKFSNPEFPEIDQERDTVWFHELDQDNVPDIYVEPSNETVSNDGQIDLTLYNYSDSNFIGYKTEIFKLVEEGWHKIASDSGFGIGIGPTDESYGSHYTISLYPNKYWGINPSPEGNVDPTRNTLQIVGLRSGKYAFQIKTEKEIMNNASATLFEVDEKEKVELTPISVKREEKEDDRMLVYQEEWNQLRQKKVLVKKVENPDEEPTPLILEQVMQDPVLRNTLYYFENEDVNSVELHTTQKTLDLTIFDLRSYMEGILIKYEGEIYSIRTIELTG